MTLDAFRMAYTGSGEAEGMKCRLLGIRGYNLNLGSPGANDLGIYDDAIVRVIGDDLKIFQASTDPGRHWIKNPCNVGGCAQLKEGLYWYKFGLHQGRRPALTQASPVTVNRLDKDGKKTSDETGYFGINIHSGGSEEMEVGRWSAGCQIIFSPSGGWSASWLDFFEPLMKACQQAGQMRVPYLLTNSLPAIGV